MTKLPFRAKDPLAPVLNQHTRASQSPSPRRPKSALAGALVAAVLLGAVACGSPRANAPFNEPSTPPSASSHSGTQSAPSSAAHPSSNTESARPSTPSSAPSPSALSLAANAPAPSGDTVTNGSATASNLDPVRTAPAPPASSRAPIRPQSSEPAGERIVREWSELWRQRGGELAAGELVDVVASDAGLTVAEGAAVGSLTSVAYSSAFPFDEVVPSWQVDTAGGSEIKVEVRALLQPGWSGWYTLGFWGDNARSQRGQDDANARVAIDTLKLRQPATAVQYRVTLTRGAEAAPLLRGFAVSLADSSRVAVNVSPVRPEVARDLDVPRRSQLQDGGSLANEICSPTSLGMVLGFWDVVQPTQQVVRGVYDRGAGIYGNWPFNTAYAAALGVTAFVDRFNSIADLEDEIAAGRPVIISVNYREGELAGAYLRRTGGHILVVRGITSDGSVIVNDPFSPDAGSVRRVYRRDQVAKVWLNNAGGVVYRLSRE